MSTRTAIVTGASRGFGRATAIALVNAGVHVIGVARDRERLDAVRDEAGAEFTPVAADAADPVTAQCHGLERFRGLGSAVRAAACGDSV